MQSESHCDCGRFGIYNILLQIWWSTKNGFHHDSQKQQVFREKVNRIFISIVLSILGLFGGLFVICWFWLFWSIRLFQSNISCWLQSQILFHRNHFQHCYHIFRRLFSITQMSKIDPVIIIRGNKMSQVVLETPKYFQIFSWSAYGSGSEFRSFSIQYGGVRFYHWKIRLRKVNIVVYTFTTMDTEYDGELYIDGINLQEKESELAAVRNGTNWFVVFSFIVKWIFCPSKCDTRTKNLANIWRRNRAQSVWKIKNSQEYTIRPQNQINFQAGEKQR